MDLSKLLSTSSYLILNFSLIKALGVEEAVVLTYLITRYRYFEETNTLMDGVAFYARREDIVQYCGISELIQRPIFKKFKEMNLVDWVDKTVPMKRFYILNFDEIEKLFK